MQLSSVVKRLVVTFSHCNNVQHARAEFSSKHNPSHSLQWHVAQAWSQRLWARNWWNRTIQGTETLNGATESNASKAWTLQNRLRDQWTERLCCIMRDLHCREDSHASWTFETLVDVSCTSRLRKLNEDLGCLVELCFLLSPLKMMTSNRNKLMSAMLQMLSTIWTPLLLRRKVDGSSQSSPV